MRIARHLKAGAVINGNNNQPCTPASFGNTPATRAVMARRRAETDGIGGGPAPFAKANPPRFFAGVGWNGVANESLLISDSLEFMSLGQLPQF